MLTLSNKNRKCASGFGIFLQCQCTAFKCRYVSLKKNREQGKKPKYLHVCGIHSTVSIRGNLKRWGHILAFKLLIKALKTQSMLFLDPLGRLKVLVRTRPGFWFLLKFQLTFCYWINEAILKNWESGIYYCRNAQMLR